MLKRFWLAMTGSVRYKLLVLVLVPILVILPLILGLTLYWFYKYTYTQLYAKVRTDLSVASDVFERLQADYLSELEHFVGSHAFQLAFWQDQQDRIQDQLELMRKTTDFSYLTVTGRESVTDTRMPSPLLANAVRLGRPGVGIQLLFRDALRESDPALAARVLMPLISTPRAAPTSRTTEDRAMMIRAVYPIENALGDTVAVLDGGVLLNRNFSLVDRIRDLVYGEGSLLHGGWGAVTVLLDDVRISTNVPLRQGEQALGTRVSAEVRDRVLGEGREWVDRAFVVNDWYISAYQPIVDVFGDRVGMLYTGYLESPNTRVYVGAVTALVLMTVFTGLLVGAIVVRGAKSIFGPIETMTRVARETQQGRDVRIGEVASRDEIGELASQFDSMLDQMKQHSDEIGRSAVGLEREVKARTRELESKNARLLETIGLLRETQHQLTVAGKLAALGQLTVGVAHEINNPTAVILGNVDILTRELGDGAGAVQHEIDLIIEQVYRIRAIVDNLLRYARPAELSGYVDEIDVNEMIATTVKLVDHELSARSITVRQSLAAGNKISISPQELQQVLINLLMNAIQASSANGVIECASTDTPDGVAIVIKDYGVGIAGDELDHVFDPFYTRKPEGTGLGLSVSYGLIQRYGGDITVASRQGEWTAFTVALKAHPAAAAGAPSSGIPVRNAG